MYKRCGNQSLSVLTEQKMNVNTDRIEGRIFLQRRYVKIISCICRQIVRTHTTQLHEN